MPYVVRINVTPVKSMALSHPDEVELGAPGSPVTGSSTWWTRRVGCLLARFGPLQTIRPSYDPDATTFP